MLLKLSWGYMSYLYYSKYFLVCENMAFPKKGIHKLKTDNNCIVAVL